MAGDEGKPPELGEFELIRTVFRPLAANEPGAFDLTDDAACLTPREGYDLVLTADTIVAGVHFLPDDPAADVGAKLLGVNLSDLAAMGAEPRGYLVTAAWPRSVNQSWIAEFALGLADYQGEYRISLLGGDTTSTDGAMTLSLTAIGEVPSGQALRRSGAKSGDLLCVSGSIGDAAAGLAVLRGERREDDPELRAHLITRYRRPLPRVKLGLALRGLATACLDVSDGLLADAGHIAETSSVGIEIDLFDIPTSMAATDREQRLAAAAGGDDYELLFAISPDRAGELSRLSARLDLALTPIGRVTPGEGVVVRDRDGSAIDAERLGYRHF